MAQICSGTDTHLVHHPGTACSVRSEGRPRPLRPSQVRLRFLTRLARALQPTHYVCVCTADLLVTCQEQQINDLPEQSKVPCLPLNLLRALSLTDSIGSCCMCSHICIRHAWSLSLQLHSRSHSWFAVSQESLRCKCYSIAPSTCSSSGTCTAAGGSCTPI